MHETGKQWYKATGPEATGPLQYSKAETPRYHSKVQDCRRREPDGCSIGDLDRGQEQSAEDTACWLLGRSASGNAEDTPVEEHRNTGPWTMMYRIHEHSTDRAG